MVSIKVDDGGVAYLADQISGSVIQTDSNFSNLQFYASSTNLDQTLRSEIGTDLDTGVAHIPTTILAQTEGVFNSTAMITISGSSIYTDGIYTTNFSAEPGRGIEGDGAITHIATNETTPSEAVFTKLFDPSTVSTELSDLAFHPTALALASGSNDGFDNKLFMANFGLTMGNDFDGHLFEVEADGSISDFITADVDPNENTALKNGEEVTGFYDVIEIAFSEGGFSGVGNYIYLLSENIEDNTSTGSSSDLWRVDSNGVAHMFVEEFADGVGSMAFGTHGDYNGYLYVATWQADAEVFRIDTAGNATSIYQFGTSVMVLDMA